MLFKWLSKVEEKEQKDLEIQLKLEKLKTIAPSIGSKSLIEENNVNKKKINFTFDDEEDNV